MNRIAIGYSTCDKPELAKRSVKPLLQPDKFDLWWADGSTTDRGRSFPNHFRPFHLAHDVRGGSGAAIVFLLSEMLKRPYEYIGLVEADVLLPQDWFEP